MLVLLNITTEEIVAIALYATILCLYVIISIRKEMKRLYYQEVILEAKIRIDKILNKHGDNKWQK